MIERIIAGIKNGLHTITKWNGWTIQDRKMIDDMRRQTQHLARRYKEREIDMKRSRLND